MSTGQECMIFEHQVGEWYYALESSFSDGNEFDWREDASAYGPFSTYDAACQHLSDNHANPGGHTMLEHADFASERDQVTDRLVEEAANNMKLFQRPTYSYRGW